MVFFVVDAFASWPLTIKPAVSLCEGGLQELTVLFDRFEEVPLTLEAQRLLHLTGAAGVVLRTEPQVLTCPTNRGEHWVRRQVMRIHDEGRTDTLSFLDELFSSNLELVVSQACSLICHM